MQSTERRITVSLPCAGGGSFLRRAVESVLGQTHGDLTLVVTNDGEMPAPWDALADINDERLVRLDLDANRGRYFADAVVLAATDDHYLMTHNARDWSSSGRVALLRELLREENADAAFSAVNRRTSAGSCTVHFGPGRQPPSPRLRPASYQAGLYRTGALRSVGGCYGGFRSGYGILPVGLLALTGRLAYLDLPLYHSDAGHTAPGQEEAAGDGFAARQAARARLEGIYEQAYRGFCGYVAGRLSHDELRTLLSALTAGNVTGQDARALSVQAARLRAQLRDRARPRRARPRPGGPSPRLAQAARAGAARDAGGVQRTDISGNARAPDVAVVIPTRYDTAELPSTVGSFLAARSRDTTVEFVIVDDASPAGVDPAPLERALTPHARFASLTVLRPPAHVGITRARNIGARYARADWLFVTDAHVTVDPGWDAVIAEYATGGRILAATVVADDTGAPGFGLSLRLPDLTVRWNPRPAADLAAVHVAASAGMALERELYWTVGGFDPGMVSYGSAEAEFSVRAWLTGAEVLSLPRLTVRHRFRSPAELRAALHANLHLVLHNRLRFALLYLREDAVLSMVRDMAASYPRQVVTLACDLVASSDVWRRKSLLREQELLTFDWLARKFGLAVPDDQRDQRLDIRE